MTETLQGGITGVPTGGHDLPSERLDALTSIRRQLHAALAAGRTEEIDRLSALCFALIRQAR
jgi:hypothetical protein